MTAGLRAPQPVQRRRTPGWRMPANTVYVGRPSRWGNMFQILRAPADGAHPAVFRVHDVIGATSVNNSSNWIISREKRDVAVAAVRLYELHTGPGGCYEWDAPEALLAPLRGRDLACWCPLVGPDGDPWPCHRDVLIARANGGRR